MPVSGREVTLVVEHPAYEVSPVWSPDAGRVAFMSTRGYELGSIGPFPGHVYCVEANGGALRKLTRIPLTSSLGPSDWSPDGRSLLISRVEGNRIRVFQLDVDSGEETPVTDSPNKDYSAVYSSDGKRIAFHSETETGADLVIQELKTGERTRLTDGGFNYGPRWSPDDQWLLFTRSIDGRQYDIHAIHVATGKMVPLVKTEGDEREGQWLKD